MLRGSWWVLGVAWLMLGVAWGAASGGGQGVPDLRPDPYASLHAVEISTVRALQAWEGWGRVMGWITDLGPGKPMLMLIALSFFLVDARFAARLTVVTLMALGLRELLAMVLQSPRPYWLDAGVRTFRDPPLGAPTFGLPSGHAMGSAAFWLFLAGEVRRGWAWGVAGTIVVLVCLSRVYLGLHFPSDVVLGAALGTLWVLAFRRIEAPVERAWQGMSPARRVVAAFGVGVGLAGLALGVRAAVDASLPPGVWPPYGATARASVGFVWSAGALCGMALAWVSPPAWTGAGDPWKLKFKRLAVAVAPAGLYFFRPPEWRLSTYLPEDAEMLRWAVRFVGGTVLAWAGFFLMPRVLQRLGLGRAPRGDEPSNAGLG